MAVTEKQNRPRNTVIMIKSILPSLHQSLQKVGDYVLEHQKQVVSMSIDELSSGAQVSKASVVRFCKALGFTGYRDFRLHYVQDFTRRKTAEQNAGEDDSELGVAFRDQFEAVRQTWEVLDPEEFERAVELIVNARQLVWFGVGASGYLAQWVNHKAGLIGANTRGIDSPDLFWAFTRQLQENDVIICFSHSGTTKSMLNALEKARPTKAKLIVITNHANSPLAMLADVTLLTADHQFQLGEQVVSFRPAHEAVANALLFQMVTRREHAG